MKLYATTTSERATKGQGGNEFLSTETSIVDEGVEYVVKVHITDHGDKYLLTILDNGEMIADRYIIKAEKKKDETCEICGKKSQYLNRDLKCEKCSKIVA